MKLFERGLLLRFLSISPTYRPLGQYGDLRGDEDLLWSLQAGACGRLEFFLTFRAIWLERWFHMLVY